MDFQTLSYVLTALCCALAAAAGWLALKRRAAAKISAEKIAGLEAELGRKSVESAVSETRKLDALERLGAAEARMSALSAERDSALKLCAEQQSKLEYMRETLQETEQRHIQLRKQLNDDFQLLASKVFDSARQKFAADGAEKISAVLSPLAENIKDFRARVEAVHADELSASAKVSAQIESLLAMNNRLSEEARNLATALKSNNKVAGNWGEAVLERIFESCGFIKNIHYRTQASFSDATAQQSRLVPDFIIDLPDNRSIIVDSKLSLVDFVEYCGAESPEQKRQSLEKFKKSVRAHLREFAKKYNEIPSVASFKLMFMPVEPAYNLVVEADKTLLSDAYRENVIIVSPVSVMAVLKYAQIAYRTEAFAKNIGELSKQGRYLCERIERFLKSFNSIQERITALQRAFDDSKKTLSDGSQSVANTARRFHELTLKSLDAETKNLEADSEDGQ